MKNYDNEETNKIKKNSTLIDSFDNAINGIIETINTERNMKVHFIVALLIMSLSILLNFTRVELIIIAITIVLVLVAEVVNTSIETLTDLVVGGKYNLLAKKVKDISAGAVLLMAVNSAFVGYLLIYPKLKRIFSSAKVINRIMHNSEHLILISICMVLALTLLIKGIFYKINTTHLQGGTVSGHSAIAFNLATIGSILVKNHIITFLFFLVAILVAESRVESKFHTIREVFLGGVLGITIGLILFFRFI